jgi:hypothetical protein
MKITRTNSLQLRRQSIRTLTPSELRAAAGGGRNPKPQPSTRVSCSGSRYC